LIALAQRQRDDQEASANAAWIVSGVRSGWPPPGPRARRGDRARQQLLDRPVDDRDDHEQHRPQQRDALVVDVAQRVRREREVRERDHAGRRDPDRQDARAAP
jgi:hypothetical protein